MNGPIKREQTLDTMYVSSDVSHASSIITDATRALAHSATFYLLLKREEPSETTEYQMTFGKCLENETCSGSYMHIHGHTHPSILLSLSGIYQQGLLVYSNQFHYECNSLTFSVFFEYQIE